MEWTQADDEWLPNHSKNRGGPQEKPAVPDLTKKKISKKKTPPEIKEIPLTFESTFHSTDPYKLAPLSFKAEMAEKLSVCNVELVEIDVEDSFLRITIRASPKAAADFWRMTQERLSFRSFPEIKIVHPNFQVGYDDVKDATTYPFPGSLYPFDEWIKRLVPNDWPTDSVGVVHLKSPFYERLGETKLWEFRKCSLPFKVLIALHSGCHHDFQKDRFPKGAKVVRILDKVYPTDLESILELNGHGFIDNKEASAWYKMASTGKRKIVGHQVSECQRIPVGLWGFRLYTQGRTSFCFDKDSYKQRKNWLCQKHPLPKLQKKKKKKKKKKKSRRQEGVNFKHVKKDKKGRWQAKIRLRGKNYLWVWDHDTPRRAALHLNLLARKHDMPFPNPAIRVGIFGELNHIKQIPKELVREVLG